MKSGRRENQVWLRISVTGLPALFNQEPPSQHDLFGNMKHPAVKHRPDSMGQPVFQCSPSVRIADEFNPERISATVTTLIKSWSSGQSAMNATAPG